MSQESVSPRGVGPQAVVPEAFPWLDASRYSFSLGIEAAGATWLSGQTASAFYEPSGRVEVRGGAGEQAELIWQKLEAVAAAGGRALSDCSELVEYVTVNGLRDRAALAAARPVGRAPSVVVVESLVRPEALVEVEIVAGAPDGLVRLPQILPVDETGSVVAPGDFVAQCEWVLEEAGRQLTHRGLTMGDVVRVVQQTTPATRRSYRDTSAARQRLLGPSFPSSTGILVSRLPHPEALVALDVWATSQRKTIVPYAVDAYRSLTFSPAVTAGELVYISGTTAWDPATGETVAPDDIVGQAEFIYDQIAQVCEAAGTSIDRLVKTIEYVTPAGVDRYRDVAAIRTKRLQQPFPTSTGVVVAGLLSRSWQIEVEAIAVMP